MFQVKQNSINRILYNFFEYLVALSLLLDGRFIWLVGDKDVSQRSNILLLILITSIMMCILFKRYIRKVNFNSCISIIFILSFYLLFYLILQNNNRISFIKLFITIIMIIIFYYLCCREENIPTVLLKYKNLVVIISIISLIIWFMGSIMNIINPSNTVISYWTGTAMPINTYYGLYYETQVTINNILGHQLIRNSAIFTEAPMANMHFCIAFLIEMFFCEKSSKTKCIILVTAIISTFSVVGYSLVIGVIMLKKLISNEKNIILQYLKYFIAPIAMVSIGIIVYFLIANKLSTYSGSYRIDDYIVCLKAWKENVVLGAGIDNDEYIRMFMGAWRSDNRGLSNSVLQILAHGGMYIGILYFYVFFLGIIRFIKYKNKEMILFTIFFLALLTVVIFTYQYLTIFILVYIYELSDRKNNNIVNNINS